MNPVSEEFACKSTRIDLPSMVVKVGAYGVGGCQEGVLLHPQTYLGIVAQPSPNLVSFMITGPSHAVPTPQTV